MKEKKLSLLNEFEKMNPFVSKDKKQDKIKDERIINESNIVMSNAFCILVVILVFGSMILNTVHIEIKPIFVFLAVAIVSYSSLIQLCKRNAIEGNEHASLYSIWGIFVLPVEIFNCFGDYIFNNIENTILFVLLILTVVIILPMFLYQIANIIYKNNNK